MDLVINAACPICAKHKEERALHVVTPVFLEKDKKDAVREKLDYNVYSCYLSCSEGHEYLVSMSARALERCDLCGSYFMSNQLKNWKKDTVCHPCFDKATEGTPIFTAKELSSSRFCFASSTHPLHNQDGGLCCVCHKRVKGEITHSGSDSKRPRAGSIFGASVTVHQRCLPPELDRRIANYID